MSLEDDIFLKTPPTIVDCDVLEAAKENVQPLGTGRRVTALSALLATPHAQRDSKLSATRNRLRINVELALDVNETDADADPLDAYCRFVYWTIENYPQGPSVESGLLELLEEATRVLKDHRGGVCRGDVRYLKLWLLYASFVERPTLIYRFLIKNEIGTDHALLYEEYAAVLERDGRRKDADDAYILGIARRAQPLDHLKARHDDFQKRMMSTPAPTPAAPSGRSVLGSGSGSGGAALTTRSVRIASTSRAPSTNAPLQIFVDPTGSESESTTATATQSTSPSPSPSPSPSLTTWTDIGTRKTRIKENVPETKKIAGTTLRHTGSGSGSGRTKRVASGSGIGASSGGSRIAVFRDPVPASAPGDIPPPPPPPPSTSVPVPAPVVKTKPALRLPPKTPAKSAFVPFVEPAASFTPFRDEALTTPALAHGLGPGSRLSSKKVMKVKSGVGVGVGVGSMGGSGSTSEMEALRRDPLKNYHGGVEGDG